MQIIILNFKQLLQLFNKLIMINVVQLLVFIKTFYSSIVNRIFGYLENILHNDIGNNVRLNEKNQFSITVIEPPERFQIFKNAINRKMHNYTNNQENSSGINNKFLKKETLQKNINFNFGDTESTAYYNDIETLKTPMNNSLYHGIFYENMVRYYTSKIV